MSAIPRRRRIAYGLLATAAFYLPIQTPFAAEPALHAPAEPALFVEQPRWQHFDAEGFPVSVLTADSLTQRPGEAESRLVEPRLQRREPHARPWQAQARLGWLDARTQRLRLEHQVHLQREPHTGGLVLNTEALQIDGLSGLIETDRAVAVTSGAWRFTADGLRADLRRQRLQLLGDVRGIHD